MPVPVPASRLLTVLAAAALAACASAPTAAPPVPAPAGPPATATPTPPPAAQAVAGPRRAPDGWHLLDPGRDRVEGAGIARAHAELLAGRAPARTVVVAVIDGGVDTAHVALRDRLWRNERERAGTGRDDDGNGYVDDTWGWNFLGGADGRSVHRDTWEVTRLHARCAAGDAVTVPAPEGATCARVTDDFHEKRQEAEQTLANVRNIALALDAMLPVLRTAVGDSLTVENVAALRTTSPQARQAQSVFLQLADNGITPADVTAALEELESQLEYKLNPSFDPRPIVGDDYANLEERGYGNPDVTGPDAKHGTHVAGIIAGVRGDGTRLESAASAIRIMAVRAVPDGDEHDKDVANAIRYAVDNGAHIINMSFGKGYSPQKHVVDAAVRYADARGVLMVHAAGNDGHDLAVEPSYPTRTYLDGRAAAHWIEVGASSWRGGDTLAAPFSNYGRAQVDLFAPGVDIVSAVPGGGFERQSGTSMAAPVVSGIAALIMAYHPELSAAEVRQVLLDTATRHVDRTVLRPGDGEPVPFGTLSVTGGIVNAYAALQRAAELSAARR